MQAQVQDELMAMAAPSSPSADMDLKALAKESILWLDDLPKQERISGMAEMKQWVKSSGLNWDLWWQYCQRARQEAPKRQASPQAGPTFLGHGSFKPRVLNPAPQFNPVPAQMKAYHDQMRSRPNVSKAQAQAIMNQHETAPRPHAEQRPSTDEEWHQLAVEALDWLGQKTKDERPAAMSQMRSWVVSTGLNWDSWWGYCRRIQEAKKKAALERQMTNEADKMFDNSQPDSPASPTEGLPPLVPPDTPVAEPISPVNQELHEIGNFRRGAVAVDAEALAQAEKEAIAEEKAMKRKRLEERKARDDAMRAQYEEWEATSAERLNKEYCERWKQANRSYTHELLGDNPKFSAS